MTGNTGNRGNTGNTGNVANAGGASIAVDGWVYADRIDYPFVLEAGGDDAPRVPSPPAFPWERWGPQWRAWLVLNELLEKVSSATHKWDSFHIDRDRPVGSGTEPAGIPTDPSGEIDVLLGYAQDNRADALGEILSQNGEFLSYFAGLLQISPGSRSATRTLLHVSELVATAAVMHFKAQANRARPSTVCPALFPPLSVPSHPAWPSGHATQARLAFAILKFTLEGNVRDANGHMHGAVPGDHGPIIAALETLADRIAKNREIAGLHFPSDTVAGKNLGDDLLEYLQGCPAFDAVVISAKNEAW